MKEEIKKIIEELQDLRNTTDELLFRKAIDIYIALLQEQNKDKRTTQIQSEKESKMASYKQKNYLEKLGYDGDVSQLTSIEASALIDELLKNEKRNSN